MGGHERRLIVGWLQWWLLVVRLILLHWHVQQLHGLQGIELISVVRVQ